MIPEEVGVHNRSEGKGTEGAAQVIPAQVEAHNRSEGETPEWMRSFHSPTNDGNSIHSQISGLVDLLGQCK